MDMLTDEEIKHMRDLEAQATGGVWMENHWRVGARMGESHCEIVALGATNNAGRTPKTKANMDFIAFARQWIPKALATIDALKRGNA